MTCAAAIVHEGRVFMAADSAGVSGDDYTHRADEKVFRVGQFVVGVSGSFRVGQVVRYVFDAPSAPESADAGFDALSFMVRQFVPPLRAALKTSGHEGDEWAILVGLHDRLFIIYSDFQVGESRDGMLAIGVARQVALATLRTFSFFNFRTPPKTKLEAALRNAAHFSAGVLPPFTHLST
jgi:ATP-dependent protease HslVU (ClpYQ) peptidase subunit